MKIAVYVGHGFVKALAGISQRALLPALAIPAPAGVDLGDFARGAEWRIDGHPWLVGEAARGHAQPA